MLLAIDFVGSSWIMSCWHMDVNERKGECSDPSRGIIRLPTNALCVLVSNHTHSTIARSRFDFALRHLYHSRKHIIYVMAVMKKMVYRKVFRPFLSAEVIKMFTLPF